METLWKTQRRSAACGLLSGVFLATAVVLSRRISGDASAFTSELAACLTGAAASLVAILAASLPDLISDRLARPQRTLLISACGIPGVMLGLAVMPAGSSAGLACLLGLYVATVVTLYAFESEAPIPGSENVAPSQTDQPVDRENASPNAALLEEPTDSLAEESLGALSLEERLILQAAKSEASDLEAESISELTVEESSAALPFESEESMPHPASNPDTTQWMSRSRVDGMDVVEGSFRVRFAAGQRLAPVHLPFSPPLADTPELECEPADDSELRFRTTAVHAYGVRIEVSRAGNCDKATTVDVAWLASATISDSVAA